MYALYNSEVIDDLVIGFLILPDYLQSSIDFGFYDSNSYTQDLAWFPLINTYWWQIGLEDAQYNGQSFMSVATSVIIDSGTSLIAMPNADFTDLINMIRRIAAISITCVNGGELCYY